ncbi:MAG: ATP-binding protein [Melioribacteraceae bacterium]|nr:ATP-binding protein [Melioribacteraceae bacterium]
MSDLQLKMVFITGPRQVGKTFVSKQIMKLFSNPVYLNYDNFEDKRVIENQSWINNYDLLIFDEIHKMKNWKLFVKGVYDKKESNQSILVTVSARMETFRQSGESLAGRYLHHRLHPLSVKELQGTDNNYNIVENLNNYGAFPEPYLYKLGNDEKESKIYSARWKNQYYTDLIREDILEFSRIHEIKTMKLLVELLRERVGSPLSFNSIAEDLQVSPNTIKKYIDILESLYIIFLVRPFNKNIARAVLKEPKAYFFDSSFIKADAGIKLENTVAAALLKHTQHRYDAFGEKIMLNYVRTRDNKEVDFVIAKKGSPVDFIEVKFSDNKPSPNLFYFQKKFESANFIQLVHNLKQEEDTRGIQIRHAGDWLAFLSA